MLRSETAASPGRADAAMRGLRAYQEAERTPRPEPMPAIATAGRATLRDYGGSGAPVVFVPSLINPPFILDLAGNNSLLRWLATQGVRPMLVDWGKLPNQEDHDVSAHVAECLILLIDSLPEPPILAGYCLGGTMAVAAAALRPVRGLALIAAPWRFAGFGDASAELLDLWANARPAAEALGLLPMEVLQSGFWRLDPGRTVRKYEAFGALDPQSDEARAFVALEDWANGGEPIPLAAARQLFEDFIRDDLPGSGRWSIGRATVDPLALSCPTLDIVSSTDRIVPAATATGLPNRLTLGAGHVGMVVGSRARAQLWEPLAAWLSHVQQG